MKKKHIIIIGMGGVGGYFGFKVNQFNEKANQYFITFVARNQTYHIIKQKGLTLHTPEYLNHITKPNAILENILDISEPDLILICVKEYDLENVCFQLKQVITEKTILMPLMNGADIYERIQKIIPKNPILPTCVYVASHIKEKGVIEHKGITGKIILGRDLNFPDVNLDWIITLLNDSLIDFDFKENPFVDIWKKFIFIASFGLVTTKYNSSIGTVCSNPTQKKEAIEILKEVKNIAYHKGIFLEDDIIEKVFEKAMTLPPETPTSLQLDINVKKGASELDLFAGTIINYGKLLNIDTPFTKEIYQAIKKYSSNE